MNAHLLAALESIWRDYAADVERRGGNPQFARLARVRSASYRDGSCSSCGKPSVDHFDSQNRKLKCDEVAA